MQDDRFSDWKTQFGLYLDESGVWRCKGRLGNADLPVTTKFLIILPNGHHFTTLVGMDCHKRVMHGGVKETPNFERNSGTKSLRRLLHSYVTCIRLDGRALHYHTFVFKSHFHSPTLELIMLDLCISRAPNPRHGLYCLHVVLQEHFTWIWFWICQQRRLSGVLGVLQPGEVCLGRLCLTIIKYSNLPARSLKEFKMVTWEASLTIKGFREGALVGWSFRKASTISEEVS